jgi:hypothetical protein
VNDVQKKLLLKAFIGWAKTQAVELQKQNTTKWRIRKKAAGWTVYRPTEIRPFGVFPTHEQALRAVEELA